MRAFLASFALCTACAAPRSVDPSFAPPALAETERPDASDEASPEGAPMTESEPAHEIVEASTAEVVVLVHGLMRSSRSMSYLAGKLRDAGYTADGFDYPSTRESLEDNGRALREVLAAYEADPQVARISLVTHSMGALITRSALDGPPFSKLHRIVMLAPPNQGSDLARWLKPVLGGVLSPLADLSNEAGSTAQRLPRLEDVELGVIAASMDHAVAEELTHLPGEQDHRTMVGLHSLLMYQPSVAAEVVQFLRTGRFRPNGKS